MNKTKIIGIDIGGTRIKSGLIGKDGKIYKKNSIATGKDRKRVEIIEDIEMLISTYCSEFNKKDIMGIGIGCPGLINEKNVLLGGCENIPSLCGTDFNILNRKFGLPVTADNDANNAAKGEFIFGAMQGSINALLITIGTGIGGGLILNKNIYHGSTRYAGEAGHMPIFRDGIQCNCGSLGCFEQYASATGMIKNAKRKIKRQAKTELTNELLDKEGAKIIFALAKENDNAALQVINETADYIGFALAGIINLLNLDTIVIGGGVSASIDIMIRQIKNIMKKYTLPLAYKSCTIRSAKLKNNAGILGSAAAVIMEQDKKLKG